MRLTVSDSDGGEIAPMRDDGIRDSTGRRYPAHLDPEPMIRNGWLYGPMSRGARPNPVAAAERRWVDAESAPREVVSAATSSQQRPCAAPAAAVGLVSRRPPARRSGSC
jgi:hypothetical protein